MEIWRPRNSSHIEEVEYHRDINEMLVAFRGGDQYRYTGVPEPIFIAWQAAPSPGKFFHSQVKNRFNYEQI